MPFGAGKVNWGSNWLIGSLAHSAAPSRHNAEEPSQEPRGAAELHRSQAHGGPGTARSCSRIHAELLRGPRGVHSPFERNQTRSRSGPRDPHLRRPHTFQTAALHAHTGMGCSASKQATSTSSYTQCVLHLGGGLKVLFNPTNPIPIKFPLTRKNHLKVYLPYTLLPPGKEALSV